ncbi:DHH family phosphoesterase [Clostridium cellulovorans]|uniref:Phosphoesterase RecJ domain protein n=1 Tax=Clostridium cellulovorans (strain ATCC 35296 / DSM 3052 / OCM 3 / 743B) TaxID=573061 RepID=D9SMV0_CLOC7|nr:DHH family phosphoesterase [Clostridium cellulovorans]ADL51816.1 phosphoesterase RecJ domain protein [Clostridium cellulovorans 743B]
MEHLYKERQKEFIRNYNKYNPFLMKNVDKALERVVAAINNQEKIVIYGYYDVDGITSVSMLLLMLRYLKADVEYFIPETANANREIQYEVVKNHIKFLGADLILTIGCGINSYNQVELCKELGIDVVIIDNRSIENIVPKTITINTKQKDCSYPFKDLSGAGMAYKFIEAVGIFYQIKSITKYLDLCMLGTISSDVPLLDENKTLVELGISHLCDTKNHGINALIEENNVYSINEAAAYKLAFTVIPRINAIGRMDNARIVVELFTTDDKYRAKQIAKYLIKEVNLNKNIIK